MPAITRPTILRLGQVSVAVAIAVLIAPDANAQTRATSPSQLTLANPASKHCAEKGGTLSIAKNGRGGQYGVCTFPDNRQCEEWAMMRGDCRVGGVAVAGYVTPAARYCAITGGKYQVTSASNSPTERGTCTLAGGKRCDAGAYYNGACSRPSGAATKTSAANNAEASPTLIKAEFGCSNGKRIAATFVNAAQNSVKLVLSDGRKFDLPQTLSGSGARYANASESIVFWNKGDTAFIEEKGKTTYDGCVTKR